MVNMTIKNYLIENGWIIQPPTFRFVDISKGKILLFDTADTRLGQGEIFAFEMGPIIAAEYLFRFPNSSLANGVLHVHNQKSSDW